MDAALAAVQRLARNSVDDATRSKVIVGLRDLMYTLESQDDTIDRIIFSHLQIAAARVGIDLKIFELLSESATPLSVQEVSQATKADSVLTGRLMRYLSSVGMIKEIAQDQFAATNVTQALANPAQAAGVKFYFDTVGPQFQALPSFLVENKYQNLTDNNNTVHHKAWKTDVNAFAWLSQHPGKFSDFDQYMAAQHRTAKTWLSVYPIEQGIQGWPSDKAIFVDIGGGIGHQSAELLGRCPNLEGQVILQDLGHCIDEALPTPGVKKMIHDIFDPQPIAGAKYYYMRAILHVLPDDSCRKVVQNVKAAMSEESVLLIDEMVFPEEKVSWQAAQFDLTMMCAHASMERTRTQWQELVDSVGLKIRGTFVYNASLHQAIMAVVLEDSAVEQPGN